MKNQERPDLGKLTTFEANSRLPVYRWLRYKEAFSRDLVWMLIEGMGLRGPVLDPFCGSGTTLLACREKGLQSVGLDVNPIALTASRAKVADYDLEALKKEQSAIFLEKFDPASDAAPTPETQAVSRFFDAETWKRLLFYRQRAAKSVYRDFFLLALANAAYECSRVMRDGAVLREKKKPFVPLAAAFRRNVKAMERDLKKTMLSHIPPKVMEADARVIPLNDKSAGAVITSPPYLGIEDYTKAYAIENFVVGGKIQQWLGKGCDKTDAYFSDMLKVLKELKRVCMSDAWIVMVMWDGFIDGKVVDTCKTMERASDMAGLSLEKIWVVNRKPALADRTRKVGELRESIIFFRAQKA